MDRSDGETALGMAWYSPEAWAQLAAIPEARIEKSYAEFVRGFEVLSREFAAKGVRVEPVSVDVGRMTEWCHRNGYKIDNRGRTIYGAALLAAGGGDDPGPIIDRTRARA
jgi:hypothetical protein